jgi:hypothetical protein
MRGMGNMNVPSQEKIRQKPKQKMSVDRYALNLLQNSNNAKIMKARHQLFERRAKELQKKFQNRDIPVSTSTSEERKTEVHDI